MFEIIDCPHCGYDNTEHQCIYESGEEFIRCVRCGYSEAHTRNDEMSSAGGKEVLDHFIGGGTGCCIFKVKGQPDMFYIGPVEDDTTNQLEKDLETYDYCKYTFKRSDQWYLKDLVNNIETKFEDGNFWE